MADEDFCADLLEAMNEACGATPPLPSCPSLQALYASVCDESFAPVDQIAAYRTAVLALAKLIAAQENEDEQ